MELDKFELVEGIIGLQTAIHRIREEKSSSNWQQWITVLQDLEAKFLVEYERIRNENI